MPKMTREEWPSAKKIMQTNSNKSNAFDNFIAIEFFDIIHPK